MQNRLFLPFSFFRKPKKLQCCKWAPLSLKKENQSRKGKRRESILFWLLSALAWRERRNFVFSQNLFLCQRPKHLPKHFVSKNCILFSTSQKGSKFLWGNFFSLWDLVNYEPGRYRPPFLPPKNKHTQRGRLGSGMTTLTWPNPPFPSFLPTFYIKYPFSRPFFAKKKRRGGIFVRRNLLFYLKQKRRVGKSQISTLVAFLCVLPPPMLGRGMLLTTFSLLSHGEKIGRASYACPSPEADWRVCLDRPLFIFVLAISAQVLSQLESGDVVNENLLIWRHGLIWLNFGILVSKLLSSKVLLLSICKTQRPRGRPTRQMLDTYVNVWDCDTHVSASIKSWYVYDVVFASAARAVGNSDLNDVF